MKKLNKVASLFATAALASSFTAVGVSAQTVDNWVSGTGLPWKNGTNELCWRDGVWTPATGLQGCDGVPPPPPPPAPPPPAPRAAPAPAPAPAPAAGRRPGADQREGHLRRRRLLRLRQVGAEARRPRQARRPGQQDERPEPGSDHRRRSHRLDRHAAVQPEAVGASRRKPSRPIWSARASRRTASTPKARARRSRSPATRPPKAARRTVAWKSKWSERAASKALRSDQKAPRCGAFCFEAG